MVVGLHKKRKKICQIHTFKRNEKNERFLKIQEVLLLANNELFTFFEIDDFCYFRINWKK